MTGTFPAPWQSLSTEERKDRAHIRTFVEQFEIVPIKVSHWSWAKEIARECQSSSDQQYEERKEWARQYLRKDDEGKFFTSPDAPVEPIPRDIRPRTRWGTYEALMVDIAWENFTDDEIAVYFRKWLKHSRPKECPKPDDKGRNKAGDWRSNLTRLGVMRLLSQFSALEIVDDRQKRFQTVWKTKQFSGKKWADVTKWNDARREAGKLLLKFFPFLPAGEKPLSWERQRRKQ